MPKIICLNCGKHKHVAPCHAEQKCCSRECSREFKVKQRGDLCATPGCGVKITEETAYKTSGGTLNRYCKKCSIKRNNELKLLRTGGAKKVKGDYQCKGDGRSRGKADKWTADMLQNPYYFSDIFHKPATPENIAREAARLGL
jgi:hypothetical protein